MESDDNNALVFTANELIWVEQHYLLANVVLLYICSWVRAELRSILILVCFEVNSRHLFGFSSTSLNGAKRKIENNFSPGEWTREIGFLIGTSFWYYCTSVVLLYQSHWSSLINECDGYNARGMLRFAHRFQPPLKSLNSAWIHLNGKGETSNLMVRQRNIRTKGETCGFYRAKSLNAKHLAIKCL